MHVQIADGYILCNIHLPACLYFVFVLAFGSSLFPSSVEVNITFMWPTPTAKCHIFIDLLRKVIADIQQNRKYTTAPTLFFHQSLQSDCRDLLPFSYKSIKALSDQLLKYPVSGWADVSSLEKWWTLTSKCKVNITVPVGPMRQILQAGQGPFASNNFASASFLEKWILLV